MFNLFEALWFFLPAGLANVAPVIVAKVPGLKEYNWPMDFGAQWRGKQLLGSHKTWRGLIVAVLTGVAAAWFLQNLWQSSDWWAEYLRINYGAINIWWWGGLLGGGAILGDAVESFFKRQAGVSSGEPWFPFDQIDYILGGIMFVYWYIPLAWGEMLLLLLVWFGMHLLFSLIGYFMGFKDKPI